MTFTIPKFEAVAPDPAYAVGPGGQDNPVSKQARALQAAGYDKAAIGAFLTQTDETQYAARLVETDAIRLHVHMAAADISHIKGYTFDPEHVFALALAAGHTRKEVCEAIITIRAQHDEDTHTDTTQYIDKKSMTDVYTARAAQVANHGR